MAADRRPRLLVVDDERGMRALVQRFAEGEGFDVVTHEGGRALLAQLSTLQADVALVDRRMPEVSGLDLLRTLREVAPECQVILMTGDARELRSVIERACILSDGRILHERELLSVLGVASRPRARVTATQHPRANDKPPELNRQTLEQTLQRVGGNRSAAARMLRISRRALYRRLDSFGLR